MEISKLTAICAAELTARETGKATINEIRAAHGLEPVPGGDVLMVKKE